MVERISSLKILLYLLACMIVFYSIYYAIGSVVFAIYSMDNFDGVIPFDFLHWIDLSDCCGTLEKVNIISMMLTFPISGAVFGFYISRWVWDFSVTTTVIHVLLSCCVMFDVPRNWTWWITLVISCLLMIGSGEGVWHLREWRQRGRLIVPECKEQTSFLHR